LLLLGLSIPLIAAVNAVRVILSGLIQEYMGVEYIRGYWHDALGIAMIVLGLFVVLGLTRVIRPNPTSQRAPDPSADPASAVSAPAASPWPTRMAMMVLSLTLLATVAAQYLAHRAISPDETPPPQLESIPLKLGPWIGTDLPVPDDVAQALTADEILHRLYSHFGYEAQVWVMYWSSRQMMRGYHHPDICWPNRGFQQQSRDVVEVQLANGGRLPITVREFARGTQRQLVLYWTQEGRRVWTEEDERRAEYEAFSHEILLERLVNPSKPPGGRLTVLIGTQTWGDGMEVKARTLELSGRVADELYRLCPWATVEESRE
jgi:EpsI family protein